MKKLKNKSSLFYIASFFFYIASIIGFVSGNSNSNDYKSSKLYFQ